MKKYFQSSINIFDKPDIVKGLGSRYFDSEGVKTDELKLVDQGVLKHYLVDTYNGKNLNLSQMVEVAEQVIYFLKKELFHTKIF